MIPVTTPTFIIKIKNENASQYLEDTIKMRVDIRQQDVLLSKETEDLVIDPASASIAVYLSQKESSKFLYKKGKIEFQVHGLLNDGNAWKTYVVDTSVDKTLSKEVIK